MRVLGIDPGLTRCGVGVVEGVPGRQCKLIAYYVVYTEPAEDIALRLLHLDESLAKLVAEHQPASVAVERVFSQHNVRTVMGTAQASAVAILSGARARLPVQTYTPSEVKAAVTGSGTAGKAQVTAMVTRLLGLDEPPRPADAADALALAICHVWRGGTRARIQAAAVAQAAAVTAAAARRTAASRAAASRTAASRTAASRAAAGSTAASRTAAGTPAARRPVGPSDRGGA
ncbi:MAG: crossover junction endodeoxyribonuclease RuvC [Actinoplanes sp.]|nr:crossover junction endodeoxyribonuclease RuvC [Actinoplanes sp.]